MNSGDADKLANGRKVCAKCGHYHPTRETGTGICYGVLPAPNTSGFETVAHVHGHRPACHIFTEADPLPPEPTPEQIRAGAPAVVKEGLELGYVHPYDGPPPNKFAPKGKRAEGNK
jgi:hypothetical protein